MVDTVEVVVEQEKPHWEDLICPAVGGDSVAVTVRGTGRQRQKGFDIRLTPEAERHLEFLSARDRRTVLDAIEKGLRYQPTVETRNRKRLRPNPLAPWELRAGALRVYFDAEFLPRASVIVVAVGVKVRETLRIAGEEVDLG